MQRWPYQCNKHSKSWGIYNRAHQYKQTTPRTCTIDKQNHAKSIKGNGYVLQMAEVPRRTRTVPILLKTGHKELGRLLHKTSSAKSPHCSTANSTHVNQWLWINQTLQETTKCKAQQDKCYKRVCKTSTKHAIVQNNDNNKCLRILWEGCVIPTELRTATVL
jgi:hypothetical protein